MKKKRRWKHIIFLTVLFLCTGCGKQTADVVSIKIEPYEKVEYRTMQVMRGDLSPQLTLTLQAENYEKINYGMMNEELELEAVHVKVGEKVKKGDVLVTFKSENIHEKLKEYKEQRDSNQLLAEHYTKIMQLDNSVDYRADIAMLKEDIRVSELYIKELEERLKDYRIIAKRKGTITYINEYLQNGYYYPGRNLVSQVCGSEKYTVPATEEYDFKVGKIYTATTGFINYELKLIDDSKGMLTFEPVHGKAAPREDDLITITLNKTTLKDVVYVDTKAVYKVNGTYFVYVLDEEGYKDVVEVKIGDTFEGYTIITEGLTGEEKVTY